MWLRVAHWTRALGVLVPRCCGPSHALPTVAGDGLLDLFVANDFGVNHLYHNEGGGSFAKVLTGEVATDGIDSQSAAWGDYDGAPLARPG